MFTGIVEETGVVETIESHPTSIRLTIGVKRVAVDLSQGESLAINGCCLTVVAIRRRRGGARVQFDLLRETWDRTNLQFVSPGSQVNLERAMAANGRFGGHIVTGHIDGMGRIERFDKSEGSDDRLLEISAPRSIMDYLIFKGSIAVDGISVTVAAVKKRRFHVWIIPHTWDVTALKQRTRGDRVNLEVDMIGKYVRQFVHTVNTGGSTR